MEELRAEDVMLAPEEAARHVTIWNRSENRKIAGNAAPLRRNLQKYLAKHPECEVYTEQDKRQAGQMAMRAFDNIAGVGQNVSLISQQGGLQRFGEQQQPPRLNAVSVVNEHVPIWHVQERRKITGNAAPLRKNLEAYLKRHPECEEYQGQDKKTTTGAAGNGASGERDHHRSLEAASAGYHHPVALALCSCGQLVPQNSLALPTGQQQDQQHQQLLQQLNGIPIPRSGGTGGEDNGGLLIGMEGGGAGSDGHGTFGMHVDAQQGFAIPLVGTEANHNAVGGSAGAAANAPLSSSVAMSLNAALATPNELAVYMGLGSASLQSHQPFAANGGVDESAAGGGGTAQMSFSPSNFLALGASAGGTRGIFAQHMQQQHEQQQKQAQQQQHAHQIHNAHQQ